MHLTFFPSGGSTIWMKPSTKYVAPAITLLIETTSSFTVLCLNPGLCIYLHGCNLSKRKWTIDGISFDVVFDVAVYLHVCVYIYSMTSICTLHSTIHNAIHAHYTLNKQYYWVFMKCLNNTINMNQSISLSLSLSLSFSLSLQVKGLHFKHTDNFNFWLNTLAHVGLPKVHTQGCI